jgi:phosphoglycolate phosphatase
MLKIKAIIFDLDGTLVNTLFDLSDAMNYGLQQLGQPIHSEDQCRMMIGDGVSTFASRALSEDNQHLQPRLLEMMKRRYREIYLNRACLYDGIDRVVGQLTKASIKLAVLTNKDDDAAKAMVEHFFGKGTFEPVIGVTGDKPIKPDPEQTFKIVSSMGLEVENFLFIGDSAVDIETAAAASMTSVGAGWGFRGRNVLKAAKADYIIDNPLEILDLLS